MQGYGNGVNAYRQAQVGTADPKRLVIMCYENVIKQLEIAKSAYMAGNYEAKGKALLNMQDTVELLLQSLDEAKGGKIAQNLRALYTYSLRRTNEGDIRKDLSALDEVSKIFSDLLDSWKALPMNPRKGGEEDRPASRGATEGLPSRAAGGM